eukprot:2207572-Prymnesium_polylepis.1
MSRQTHQRANAPPSTTPPAAAWHPKAYLNASPQLQDHPMRFNQCRNPRHTRESRRNSTCVASKNVPGRAGGFNVQSSGPCITLH